MKTHKKINLAEHQSFYGDMLIVSTDDALCALFFLNHGVDKSDLTQRIQKTWPQAELTSNDKPVKLFEKWLKTGQVTFDLIGTPFQQEVWQALQQIPQGETRTYQQLAQAINKPKAVRAVGTAIGKNPVSWIIPCHRVIRSNGEIGQYLWGSEMKRTLLLDEERAANAG